jgi:HKD family nuclease
MRIEAISQSVIGGRPSLCVGDVLNKALMNPQCFRFRFAVAYMRVSGLRLLYDSLLKLYKRQGSIAGAVGIDDGVTSIEALQLLASLSSTSTLVHTVSDYIYHPKLYMIEASQSAVIIIGSANLTRDGLYRNVELATAITLDLTSSADQDVYKSYNTVLDELLNVNNPNVQPINKVTLKWLAEITACENDIETPDSLAPKRTPNKAVLARFKEFFPSLPVSRYPQGVQVPAASSLMVIDEKSPIQSHEVPAHGTPIVGPQESERIATREAKDYQSFSTLKDTPLKTTQEPQVLETSSEGEHLSSKNDDFKTYDTTDVSIFNVAPDSAPAASPAAALRHCLPAGGPKFTQHRKVESRIRQFETQQILPVNARADRLRCLAIGQVLPKLHERHQREPPRGQARVPPGWE